MSTAEKTSIPAMLISEVQRARERLSRCDDWSSIEALDPRVAAQLDRVLACSEYVADVLARNPQALAQVVESGRMHREMKEGEFESLFLQSAVDNETESQFMSRLRRFRHREMMRIVVRDLSGWATTRDMLRELSALADTCIRAAYLRSSSEMQARYGVPRGAAGAESVFIIVAMGKLGGGELNFSSDVDLVFVYSESGDTDGNRSLSNEEYFRRLAQHFINLMSKKTADGFVYRVDARLRPFGESGPLACSVGAFEDYLLQHGRDWERYAWVKARTVNAWEGSRDYYINVVRPFIYRRYLDFGVFGSLREMKAMIEREGRAAENRDNIKIGPGGIREIEFIVQTLQLVRGGAVPTLRGQSLLTALQELGVEGLMPPDTVAELTTSYLYLRDLENRIQAIADRQTHELPANELDRARLTLAMNCSSWDELYTELNTHREIVKTDFEHILRHERNAESDSQAAATGADRDMLLAIAENTFADPAAAVETIDALLRSGLYQRMDEIAQQRLNRLLPAMLAACGSQGSKAQPALESLLRIIEAIGRRSAYISLLNESQGALERLVKLCASSDMLARQVAAHPMLLDELLDSRVFTTAPTRDDLEREIHHRLELMAPEDAEQRYEALRNFQQAAVFRVAVADLSGVLPLMLVSDRLTDVAELVLEEALQLAQSELQQKHGVPHCTVDGVTRVAGFAVAGYGKLGGLELGYGSDLDIVFLHDSMGEQQQTDGEKSLDNGMFFGRVARRVTNILTMHTPTGPLYEVDTRLRPSGNSGLLVTSLQALDRYQKDDAWTWEHQALLRARAVAGAEPVRAGFESLRIKVLQEYVRRDTLKDDVIKMRDRMRAELSKSTPELFDLKQGKGRLIDIEFLVQYLVLLHSPERPELLRWSDNVRQLEALGNANILTPEQAESLADIYRIYRVRMHLLSLAGEPRLVSREEFSAQAEAVEAQWQRFLGSAEISL